MSGCAEMKRLKKAQAIAWAGDEQTKEERITRAIFNHWDGCNECQGLAVVEQEPAVDESCSECQPGPEEVE